MVVRKNLPLYLLYKCAAYRLAQVWSHGAEHGAAASVGVPRAGGDPWGLCMEWGRKQGWLQAAQPGLRAG